MRIGDVIAERFVLLERAGAGGWGTVFRAEDRQTGRTVALKAMRDQPGEHTRRFEREARLLSELRHRRIVGHVGHGVTAEGEPWLAMEWLSGEDLGKRLGRGPLGIAESVSLALALAEGLGFAHGLSVVHRDLKPSNVFLVGGRAEDARILDFGIARRVAGTRMTRTGVLVGTPGYMAPEQVRGSQKLTPQVDVYSLGCVLYECLTGEPLLSGQHAVALLLKALVDETPRVRDRLGGLPKALCDLLERMLSKDPGKRPRDGAEVAEALARFRDLPATPLLRVPSSLGASQALTDSEQKSVAVLLVGPGEMEDPALDEALRDEAERYGGYDERLQDGTLSVLMTGTSPLPTDLAALAARCALALRSRAPDRQLVLSMAMGRVDVTGLLPMEQVIDRAARLLGEKTIRTESANVAPVASVVLDDVVAGLLDARFDVQEESGTFVLCGERELLEGTRMLLGKATPCVGREREMRQLERTFEDCIADSVAQSVLVTAPAGTGKSRLTQEFLRQVRARQDAFPIWIGRADSLRAGSTLGLLGQVVRDACGARESEALEVWREKIRARVAELVSESERARVAEFLGELCGSPFPDETSAALRAARVDAQLMAEQMRRAFIDLLRAACARSPVLIVLEDLHWGDRATVSFLDRALKELDEMPLLVLALARPEVYEVFPKLWSERRSQELRLRELSRKAIERLARHVLNERATAETIDRLANLSEGNAFYLEELLRWAAEDKSRELPATVVAMVQARLGALDDEARKLLRAASVFGEMCWPGAVASLVGAERTTSVRQQLAVLVERELLVKRPESRFPGEEQLAFRHALLREGAYAMLTESDRVAGHRLAAEWLEAHGEREPIVMAEHCQRGGDLARAGYYYGQAAAQARLVADTDAQIAYARQGLECGVPDDVRVMLLSLLCDAYFWRCEYTLSLHVGEELIRLAPPGSPEWVQGLVNKHGHMLTIGDVDGLIATLDALRGVAPAPDALRNVMTAYATAAFCLDVLGRHDLSRAIMAEGRAIERQLIGQSTDRWLDHVDGYHQPWANENPWEGLRAAERRLATSLEANAHLNIRAAHGVIGLNAWHLGAVERAERELRTAIDGIEFVPPGTLYVVLYLVWLLLDRGAIEEARAVAVLGMGLSRASGMGVDEGRAHWALAEVFLREHDLDAAEQEIRSALSILSILPLERASAEVTLASILLKQRRTEEALPLVQTVTSRFRPALARLLHAEALHATGRHQEAHTAIAQARAHLFNRAKAIPDPELRTSFLERVPEHARILELARTWVDQGGSIDEP